MKKTLTKALLVCLLVLTMVLPDSGSDSTAQGMVYTSKLWS